MDNRILKIKGVFYYYIIRLLVFFRMQTSGHLVSLSDHGNLRI